jgi:hypothetical protein
MSLLTYAQVELVWKAPWTRAKVLLLLTRYNTFFVVIRVLREFTCHHTRKKPKIADPILETHVHHPGEAVRNIALPPRRAQFSLGSHQLCLILYKFSTCKSGMHASLDIKTHFLIAGTTILCFALSERQ